MLVGRTAGAFLGSPVPRFATSGLAVEPAPIKTPCTKKHASRSDGDLMKVVGIEIKSSETLIICLDGTRRQCCTVPCARTKIALPHAAASQIENLLLLRDLLKQLLSTLAPDKIAYIRADQDASPIRSKVECMLQLAAFELKLTSEAVPIQTVNAAIKTRVLKEAGSPLSDLLGGIDPGYLMKAAHCAWAVLK